MIFIRHNSNVQAITIELSYNAHTCIGEQTHQYTLVQGNSTFGHLQAKVQI